MPPKKYLQMQKKFVSDGSSRDELNSFASPAMWGGGNPWNSFEVWRGCKILVGEREWNSRVEKNLRGDEKKSRRWQEGDDESRWFSNCCHANDAEEDWEQAHNLNPLVDWSFHPADDISSFLLEVFKRCFCNSSSKCRQNSESISRNFHEENKDAFFESPDLRFLRVPFSFFLFFFFFFLRLSLVSDDEVEDDE